MAGHTPLAEPVGEVVSSRQMISAQSSMKLHEFRPVTDGSFISKDIIQSINDGSFAKQLIARGIKIMNGEVQSEHYLYGVRSPHKFMIRQLTILEGMAYSRLEL